MRTISSWTARTWALFANSRVAYVWRRSWSRRCGSLVIVGGMTRKMIYIA